VNVAVRRRHVTSRWSLTAPQSEAFGLWEAVRMATGNLRVTKRLGKILAVGVCTFCDRLFTVPMTALKRVADAQESLRVQFTQHKCKREDAS